MNARALLRTLPYALPARLIRCPFRFRAMFVANCRASDSCILRDEASKEVFKPVSCNHCQAEVGVMDEDEVYHFFHVLAGEPI